MKPRIVLAAFLALAACENPITKTADAVDHFVDPPEEKTIIIRHCSYDTLAEPKPPGMPADTCGGGL